MKNRPVLSIIISVYNEESVLKKFFFELRRNIKGLYVEIIFVNDGSIDNSLEVLKQLKESSENTQIINLSRNFGHEAAMLAGIDHAKGRYIICLDADLQHPPTLIKKMLDKAEQGADIVLAKRRSRNDVGLFRNAMSNVFYKLLNYLSPVTIEEGASDYFLISERIQKILKKDYRERIRFLRGIIQSMGFKKRVIEFDASERYAGESNYNLFKLMKLSAHAVVSFSNQPLYLGIYMGIFFALFSLSVTIYSIIMKFIGNTPPGYTTIVVSISLLFSIQFFLIGIIGIYIGFMFEELKRRPVYLIDRIYR